MVLEFGGLLASHDFDVPCFYKLVLASFVLGRHFEQDPSSIPVSLMAAKPITSPVPVSWYPTLSVFMLAIGLVLTASFFIYETTSSRKSRSLAKELTTAAVASFFLGFGSLFLLLASGVYV